MFEIDAGRAARTKVRAAERVIAAKGGVASVSEPNSIIKTFGASEASFNAFKALPKCLRAPLKLQFYAIC